MLMHAFLSVDKYIKRSVGVPMEYTNNGMCDGCLWWLK